jgi:hypothetical protein
MEECLNWSEWCITKDNNIGQHRAVSNIGRIGGFYTFLSIVKFNTTHCNSRKKGSSEVALLL